MPIWRAPTPRQSPWQPQPLRKPVGVGSVGPQTYPITVSAAQTQTLAVVQRANLIRALSQAQTATVVAQKVFLRVVSTSQAQSLALVKQIGLPRAVAQSQTLTLRQAATLSRALTQAQSLTVRQAVTLSRGLNQAQVVSLVRRVNLTRAFTQAQSATLTLLLLGTTYFRTVSTSIGTTLNLTFTAGVRQYLVAGSTQVQQLVTLVFSVRRKPPPVLEPGPIDLAPFLELSLDDTPPALIPTSRPAAPSLKPY